MTLSRLGEGAAGARRPPDALSTMYCLFLLQVNSKSNPSPLLKKKAFYIFEDGSLADCVTQFVLALHRAPVESNKSERTGGALSQLAVQCIRAVKVSRSSRFGSSICLAVTKLQSISQKMVSMDPGRLFTGQEWPTCPTFIPSSCPQRTASHSCH